MATSGLARKIFGYVRPYTPLLGGALVQVFVLLGFELLKPWPLKLVIDNALGGKPVEFGPLLWLLPGIQAWSADQLVGAAVGALVVIYLLSDALTVLYNGMAIWLGQRMVTDLRGRLYAHLQRLSLAYHSRQRVGDLMMRVTADSYAVQTMIMNGVLPILQALVLLIGMIIVLAPIDPELTLVSLSIVPLLFVLIGLFNRKIADIATVARDNDSLV